MPPMNDDFSPAAIDRTALELAIRQQGVKFHSSITAQHAHLFADAQVYIAAEQLAQMEAVIAAVELVVKLPGWEASGDEGHSAKGVFFGYDFHLNERGAHLIEINTNAGGAFLNALLLKSQISISSPGRAVAVVHLEHDIVEMFRNEWRLERGDAPLGIVAIVDEQPAGQYLYPEFVLAQQMFERAGIRAVIADPMDLAARPDGLYFGDDKIALIYNRLTDFSLGNHPALYSAYRNKQVVVTPHPQAYARYADKRNLARLTDAGLLRALGASEDAVSELQRGIPQTRVVGADDAVRWWEERKQWFFKPVTGYGAKGAYRGDKLTKRVFEEILAGDYVAQKLALPGECRVHVNGEEAALKYDVRCYIYDGQIQLAAARLYQGQTTNFRTPGGGFALVRVLT
ncbi:MAG: hypothetical protein FD173_1574 [Gallionellaceae bacterium]|nr:MAG: hypothetical protein FD173_1574 [Gallionellaceae bacterium]